MSAEAIHLLQLPLKHKMSHISDLADELEKYFLLDGSRDIQSIIYVKSNGTVARYFVKKSDGTILPFFFYNEALNKFFMGVTSVPMQIQATLLTLPTTEIPKASDITFLSGKILNAINAVLRLPGSRPASPSAGDCRYDPATDTFEIYDGAVWRPH